MKGLKYSLGTIATALSFFSLNAFAVPYQEIDIPAPANSISCRYSSCWFTTGRYVGEIYDNGTYKAWDSGYDDTNLSNVVQTSNPWVIFTFGRPGGWAGGSLFHLLNPSEDGSGYTPGSTMQSITEGTALTTYLASIVTVPSGSAWTPTSQVVGFDGALWASLGGEIVRQIGGGTTRYSIPGASDPHIIDLARGPSSKIWYVDRTRDVVGSIAMDGQFGTEIQLPSGSAPTSIVEFEDNLWVTESGTGKLAKVSPEGEITHYTIESTPSGTLKGLVVHPNVGITFDSLWFVSSDSVNRFTPEYETVDTIVNLPESSAPIAVDWAYQGKTSDLGKTFIIEAGRSKIAIIDPVPNPEPAPTPTPTPVTKCTVPELKGLSKSEAKAALVANGCRLGEIVKLKSRKVTAGKVISSSPRAGKQRALRAKVQLTLSKGSR